MVGHGRVGQASLAAFAGSFDQNEVGKGAQQACLETLSMAVRALQPHATGLAHGPCADPVRTLR